MIKKNLAMFLCVVTTGLFAQQGTTSPYSFFGIGDIRNTNTVENQMMGGIAVYADSIHISLKNPASYASLGLELQSKEGLVVYTAGISDTEYTYRTNTAEERSSVTNLDYLSLGFNINKRLGMGFGIMPFSSIGYSIAQETISNDETITTSFTGEGGLSRVYYSVGYKILKDVSIGATVNYNFGNIDREILRGVAGVQFGSFDRKSARINGVDFNYAINYAPTIKKDYQLHTSFRINTQANLVSKNKRRVGSFSTTSGVVIEGLEVDVAAQNLENTTIKIPTITTIGLGYGKKATWFLGAEYSFQDLGAFENEFLGVANVSYSNASSFAFGGFYTPDATSFSSYFKRVTYRAGLRSENSGMMVDDVAINNFGITFGLGLPLGRSLSNLNLGFELGKRGTTRADLVEESYFKINIGLSLNDRWFQKRKIN